ncbi:hypothetical protein AKJ62_04910 [candidate division MSBL1 archaeon SCGC-AAA259D14]|uniref:SsuA/THI5-like domain-containing protein n=1 Tax=candidate division MSBL1 archaeon SCGC-AAA259D14 TaxID=1698261 RepID=A0A133U306_9EURY|nr:hypothetical protein AKJ62_04910 [candidate division MSBL1 archaeon SCGC-AAA259D14]
MSLKSEARRTALVAGQVDYTLGSIHVEGPVIERETGKEPNLLRWGKYGFNIYQNGLVCRKKYMETHPEIVEGFTRAYVRGWSFYIENPVEAVNIIANMYPELDKETEQLAWKYVMSIRYPPKVAKDGKCVFDPELVEETIDTIHEAFDIPMEELPKPEDIYTNEFVKDLPEEILHPEPKDGYTYEDVLKAYEEFFGS